MVDFYSRDVVEDKKSLIEALLQVGFTSGNVSTIGHASGFTSHLAREDFQSPAYSYDLLEYTQEIMKDLMIDIKRSEGQTIHLRP